MGLSCFRAICGYGLDGLDGNFCVGLFYEHRFVMLINTRFWEILRGLIKKHLEKGRPFGESMREHLKKKGRP